MRRQQRKERKREIERGDRDRKRERKKERESPRSGPAKYHRDSARSTDVIITREQGLHLPYTPSPAL